MYFQLHYTLTVSKCSFYYITHCRWVSCNLYYTTFPGE